MQKCSTMFFVVVPLLLLANDEYEIQHIFHCFMNKSFFCFIQSRPGIANWSNDSNTACRVSSTRRRLWDDDCLLLGKDDDLDDDLFAFSLSDCWDTACRNRRKRTRVSCVCFIFCIKECALCWRLSFRTRGVSSSLASADGADRFLLLLREIFLLASNDSQDDETGRGCSCCWWCWWFSKAISLGNSDKEGTEEVSSSASSSVSLLLPSADTNAQ